MAADSGRGEAEFLGNLLDRFSSPYHAETLVFPTGKQLVKLFSSLPHKGICKFFTQGLTYVLPSLGRPPNGSYQLAGDTLLREIP